MKLAIPTFIMLVGAATAGSWIFPLLVAVLCGVLCVLAALREDDRLPTILAGNEFFMSLLDTLTDRSKLKTLLAKAQLTVTRDFDRVEVTKSLKEGIIGHDAVINDVVQQVWAGFKMTERDMPIGVFMFAGPPSTGKTQFGRVLGKALFGAEGAYLLDMASFSNGNSISTLLGAAPGLIGSESSSGLITHLTAHPASVIILDEFEKAHREVQRLFLSAWNEGVITDHSTGKPVSTRDVVFVVTTNAMQDAMAKLAATFTGTRDELSDKCKELLERTFEDSLLSRINYVFPLHPLEGEDLAELIGKNTKETVAKYGMKLTQMSAETLVNYVIEASKRGVDARAMRRKVAKDIQEQVIMLKEAGHQVVTIAERDGQVFVEPAREPALVKATPKAAVATKTQPK